MSPQIREQIEALVDTAWELHDKAKSKKEQERYKLEVLDLLSRLPENEERLKIVQ